MCSFLEGLLWISKTVTNDHTKTEHSVCLNPLLILLTTHEFFICSLWSQAPTQEYSQVSMKFEAWGLHKVDLKWSQTVQDKEFLVEIQL